MNKLKYKEEEILKPWIILLAFYLIILLLFHNQLFENSVPIIVLGTSFFIFALNLIKSTIECKNTIHKYNEIKFNGQKSEGKIIKAISESKIDYRSSDYHSYVERYVMVEYIDSQTQQFRTYITPALSFNPYRDLGSKNCNVYTYHNKIYVTDFVKRKIGQKNIWTKEEIISTLEK